MGGRVMKTDELVDFLAAGAIPVQALGPRPRFALALGWGACGATLLMAIMLGVRPDLAAAALLPMFWAKLVYAGALAAGSLVAAMRLSRPGAALGRAPAALAAVVIAMGSLAAATLARAEASQWPALLLGQTWRSCPFLIAALSVPVFIAVLWAMKGLAPTRLRLAGGAAGLLAGATGALVYTLHCPELAAPFLAVWYLLGMLVPAAVGLLLGPRLLRW
jgi:hypothetical protein